MKKKSGRYFNLNLLLKPFSWMTEVALEAEKIDHHPDWTNVYSSVDVTLSTHDQNKLTNKDLSLAKTMENAFVKYNY